MVLPEVRDWGFGRNTGCLFSDVRLGIPLRVMFCPSGINSKVCRVNTYRTKNSSYMHI